MGTSRPSDLAKDVAEDPALDDARSTHIIVASFAASVAATQGCELQTDV